MYINEEKGSGFNYCNHSFIISISVLFLLFKFCNITADAMQHTHIEILAQPPICYSRMPFHIMGDHHLPGSGLAAAINILLVLVMIRQHSLHQTFPIEFTSFLRER